MTDKEIKQKLKDTSLYLSDASKRWPKYKDIAWNNVKGALAVMDQVYSYVERPLGGKEDE